MSVEATLRAQWERVLGGAGSGPDDSLCDWGGDAVAASSLLALVRDAFDVDIPLPSFLAEPTVSKLTALVESALMEAPLLQAAPIGAAPGEPVVITETAPLAFSQEGMLWHEQFAPGSFNMAPFVRRYEGPLDVAALHRALSDLVARHAPLRTTFEIAGGRAMQRVWPLGSVALPVVDLRRLDSPAQRARIAAAVEDAGSRPFDLSVGPLFQPRLFRLGDCDHVMLIRLHHLAFDDWAVAVFRRELQALYRAHAAGEVPGLPPLGVEFAEFCRRQRRRMAGIGGTRELAYWKRALAGAPLTVPLPLGDPAHPLRTRFPATAPLTHPLSPDLVRALTALAHKQRCTLYMAMLAVFAVVVHGYTGQEDLLLASVVANRNAADLEALIGCFTKKILLRLRLGGGDTFLETVLGARTAVLEALAHQDLAFEAILQEVLGPDAAALGVVPDVSVMFQADTPHQDRLTLPGLRVGGFDTGSTASQPHFAAGEEPEGDAGPVAWGAGIYRGTFLILSVVEGDDGVSLVARGAFHPPSVERILARFDAVLADVVARPAATVSELASTGQPGPGPDRPGPERCALVRGFLVDPSRIEAGLAGCPGLAEVAVVLGDGPSSTDTIVAYVVADGAGPVPTLSDVRAHLWSRLPGYAWPTALVVVPTLPVSDRSAGRLPEPVGRPVEGTSTTATRTRVERDLANLWAEVLGAGPVGMDANYWQKFSFVEVLRRAPAAGMDVTAEQVRRNRTLENLATDMAAGRG